MTALNLASWILHKHPQPITHLALQKLVFYSYGAASAPTIRIHRQLVDVEDGWDLVDDDERAI
jgi:uncharacterized phage-associated protein